MKSHVVYCLDCLNCSAGYIRVTTRSLPAKAKEHRDALKSVRSSAAADHSLWTGHGVDWSNVKVLACDYNEHNLFYLESLIILKHKLTLNKMQTSVNINLFTKFKNFLVCFLAFTCMFYLY